MKILKHIENPYQYLFPVGVLSGAIGATIWLLYSLQVISFYPRTAHGHMMFFGFLWSFVAGFLMTAFPKMTRTFQAQIWEIIVACALPLLLTISVFIAQEKLTSLISIAQFVFLISYLLRRYLIQRTLPFESFIFVPFALVMMLLGIIGNSFFSESSLLVLAGQAFVLNLICGIGTRLIPAISRAPQALTPDLRTSQEKMRAFFLLALLLNFSFVLEYLSWKPVALILRAAFIIYYSIKYFYLHEKPMSLTYSGWGLKASIGFLVLGYLLAAFFPTYELSCLHLAYLGGLALLTLMVATRVSLAHNGAGMQYELNAKVIVPTLSFLIFATLLRPLALNNPMSTFVLLSAVLFIFSLIAWYGLIGLRKK